MSTNGNVSRNVADNKLTLSWAEFAAKTISVYEWVVNG